MSYMLQDAMSKIIFIEVFIFDFFPSTTTIVYFQTDDHLFITCKP